MQMSIDRLRVEITTTGCQIPSDERTRLQSWLTELGDHVREFADPALEVHVINHPRSERYHVECKLKLPGRTLFAGEQDPYLDSALERAVTRLTRKVEAYKEHPDREAADLAGRRAALDQSVVAPEDPDTGPLAEAAGAGNYRAFRTALVGYEDWLRLRVGRMVQRYPEAQARVGGKLLLGDVVEEVYLNAFENFTRRPTAVSFREWLDGLIDPSLHALLRHPDEEQEAASMARTVRAQPLE